MNGKTLEEEVVDQLKHLGSTQTKDGTSTKEVEVKIRLAQAHSATTWLAIPWKHDRHISFPTKIKLYKSLVLSGCDSWTLSLDMERRIQAFKNKCYRRMLGISYRDHKTNEYVWQQVSILAGRQELLLSTVKRRKISRFGHVCRHSWYAAEDHTTKEQWVVVVPKENFVNHGRTTSGNGEASRCHHCCTSRTLHQLLLLALWTFILTLSDGCYKRLEISKARKYDGLTKPSQTRPNFLRPKQTTAHTAAVFFLQSFGNSAQVLILINYSVIKQ